MNIVVTQKYIQQYDAQEMAYQTAVILQQMTSY